MLQAFLEITSIKYNHGILCNIMEHPGLKYQHGDKQLIMRADYLKMRTRQMLDFAANPSSGDMSPKCDRPLTVLLPPDLSNQLPAFLSSL